MQIKASYIFQFYLLSLLCVSALYAVLLGQKGPVYISIFIIFLLLSVFSKKINNFFDHTELSFPPIKKNLSVTLFTGLLFIPLFLLFIITRTQNFPQFGDHDHHLLALSAAHSFWKLHFIPIILFFSLSIYVLLIKQFRFAGPILFSILFLYAFLFQGPGWYFARYPGSAYTLSFPLYYFFNLIQSDYLLNSLRITNILSIPIWLYILRPIIIKKWPSINILPFLFLLLLQKDIIYYLQSSYLEPWSIVFILLAVESALKNKSNSYLACLCIGCASLFKEQAILFLPFIWWITQYKNLKSKKIENLALSLLLALMSVLPFLIYYKFRKQNQIFRQASINNLSEILSLERLIILWEKLSVFYFPSLGVYLMIFFVIFILFSFFKNLNKQLHIKLSLLLAILFQIIFIWIDPQSANWTGYFRFLLMPLSAFLILSTFIINKKSVFIICFLSLIALLPNTFSLISSSIKADQSRNFLEHTDAPVFYPVNELIRDQINILSTHQIKTINVLEIQNTRLKGYLSLQYPSLSKSYEWNFISSDIINLSHCSCKTGENTALFLPLIFKNNMLDSPPYSLSQDEFISKCTETIKNSCNTTIKSEYNNTITGILGLKK